LQMQSGPRSKGRRLVWWRPGGRREGGGGALGLGRRGEVLGAQGGRREGKEGWRRWGGGPWTAARAAEGRGAHGWARGGPGLVIPCRELANTTHPRKGGDLSLYRPYRLGLQETQYKHKYNSIYLTPARSRRGSLSDSKTGPKISKQLYRKTLSHNVSKLM